MCSSCRNYYNSTCTGQLNLYNNIHLSKNIKFIKSLDNNTFSKLLYRFHWNFGFNEQDLIKKNFNKIKISKRENQSHFYEIIYKSSIVIVTTDYTTLKELFTLNHPTIILC